MVLKKERGWEMGDGRKKWRALVVGGSWKLNGFRDQGGRVPWKGPGSRCSWGASQKGRVSF